MSRRPGEWWESRGKRPSLPHSKRRADTISEEVSEERPLESRAKNQNSVTQRKVIEEKANKEIKKLRGGPLGT